MLDCSVSVICKLPRPLAALFLVFSSAVLIGQSAPAVITSPSLSQALPGSTVTFAWTTGTNVTQYVLYVGTVLGGKDIAGFNAGVKTSVTLTNIPTAGRTLYVTLYSKVNGLFQHNAYTFTEFSGAPGAITSPASGSTLSGSTATFSWTKGTNVSGFILDIGTAAGAHNIANVPLGSNTSATVSNLPTCGSTLYVTLFSKIGDAYQSRSYTYKQSGTAASTLAVTPTSYNFGNVKVGSSGATSGKLTTSCTSVTVSGATTTNSAVFTVGGLSLPITIPAFSSAAFNVTFSPKTSGTASATLSISSNASVPSTKETFTGNGYTTSTHTVALSWKASTSSGVVGYNIYRALYKTSCGAFSKINSVLDTSTVYSDTAVSGGSSYCYAATSVNSSKVESAFSNVASNVQIPTT